MPLLSEFHIITRRIVPLVKGGDKEDLVLTFKLLLDSNLATLLLNPPLLLLLQRRTMYQAYLKIEAYYP